MSGGKTDASGEGPATEEQKDATEEEAEEAGGWLTLFVRRAGPQMSAAYTLTGSLLGLGLLGFFVDRWLGSSPAFLLAGLGLGLIVGFYELARVTFGPRRKR